MSVVSYVVLDHLNGDLVRHHSFERNFIRKGTIVVVSDKEMRPLLADVRFRCGSECDVTYYQRVDDKTEAPLQSGRFSGAEIRPSYHGRWALSQERGVVPVDRVTFTMYRYTFVSNGYTIPSDCLREITMFYDGISPRTGAKSLDELWSIRHQYAQRNDVIYTSLDMCPIRTSDLAVDSGMFDDDSMPDAGDDEIWAFLN
jgi:hypothetical protein